jgi:HAD superfamily hydrolase (TIGR01509 family)
VLIDFGGTLDADGVRWAVRFHAAYRRSGGRLSLRRFEPVFRASDRALEQVPGIRGMGFRAMIEAQAALLRDLLRAEAGRNTGGGGGKAIDAAKMAAHFHEDAVRAVARNRVALDTLCAGGMRLAMISNFTGNLEHCLDELGIRSCFAAVTDSSAQGIAKPDPALFARTLRAVGASPAEAWMIGDNPVADIRPARDMGMGTIWIAPLGRRAPAGLTPTLRLGRFADVPSALAAVEAACTA